jgi:hypothetical protein
MGLHGICCNLQKAFQQSSAFLQNANSTLLLVISLNIQYQSAVGTLGMFFFIGRVQ